MNTPPLRIEPRLIDDIMRRVAEQQSVDGLVETLESFVASLTSHASSSATCLGTPKPRCMRLAQCGPLWYFESCDTSKYRGGITVPGATILDIPQPEQEWMLAELRRARYGYVLALHVLLLCAAGRTPTEIASFLFCSRSSVYRSVNAYCAQRLAALRDEPPAKAGMVDAVAAPQPAGRAPPGPVGLRVVPHAVELCDAGGATPAPARQRGLGLDAAAVAARAGVGVEASPTGRPRRRPGANREARPHPARARNPGETGGGAVCRRTRQSPAAQGRLSVDAPGPDGPARDAWPEPETLPGRGAGAEDRADHTVR